MHTSHFIANKLVLVMCFQ